MNKNLKMSSNSMMFKHVFMKICQWLSITWGRIWHPFLNNGILWVNTAVDLAAGLTGNPKVSRSSSQPVTELGQLATSNRQPHKLRGLEL